MSVVWLFKINIFPDIYKGMVLGVIKALAIQNKGVYVHLVGHWTVYPTLIYLLAFKYEMGITGLWIAKIALEVTNLSGYLLIVHFSDWDQIAVEAEERLQR